MYIYSAQHGMKIMIGVDFHLLVLAIGVRGLCRISRFNEVNLVDIGYALRVSTIESQITGSIPFLLFLTVVEAACLRGTLVFRSFCRCPFRFLTRLARVVDVVHVSIYGHTEFLVIDHRKDLF